MGGNGRIVKGPAKFIGSTVEDLQGNSSKYSKSSSSKVQTGKRNGASNSSSSGGSLKEKSDSQVLSEYRKYSELAKNAPQEYDDKGNMLTGDAFADAFPKMLDARSELQSRGYAVTDSGEAIKYPSGLTSEQKRVFTRALNNGKSSSEATKIVLGNRYDASNGGTTAPAKTSNPTFNSATTGATMKKYPSGITTTAQKRAYTSAINRGKSTSEAVKIAKNAGTSSQTTYVAGFSKSMNREFQRLVSSGMSEDEAVSVVVRNAGYGRNGRGWHM